MSPQLGVLACRVENVSTARGDSPQGGELLKSLGVLACRTIYANTLKLSAHRVEKDSTRSEC